jgi:hypothetical protein
MGKRRSHHRNHQAQQQQQQAQQQQQQAQQQQQQSGAGGGGQQQTGQQSQLQSVSSVDVQRSPEYQPQFALPAFGAQGFQQYSTNLHNSDKNSGNGLAGPSELFQQLASRSKGLQPNSNNLLMQHQRVDQDQQLHISTIHMPTNSINSINNSMDQEQPYPLVINTNMPTSYIITEAQNYHHTIGRGEDEFSEIQHQQHQLQSKQVEDQPQIIIHSTQTLPSLHPNPHGSITSLNSYDTLLSRFAGGYQDLAPFSPYQGDMAPTSSAINITTYQDEGHESMPETANILPLSPIVETAPTSPSLVSSTAGNNSMHISSTISNNSSTLSSTSNNTGEHRCLQCDKVFNKSCYLTQHNKTCHSGMSNYILINHRLQNFRNVIA